MATFVSFPTEPYLTRSLSLALSVSAQLTNVPIFCHIPTHSSLLLYLFLYLLFLSWKGPLHAMRDNEFYNEVRRCRSRPQPNDKMNLYTPIANYVVLL